MSDNDTDAQNGIKISAKALRETIQKLGPILGGAVVNDILYDLKMQGLQLTNDQEYSLAQVQTALEKMFSTETAALLIEYVKRSLL